MACNGKYMRSAGFLSRKFSFYPEFSFEAKWFNLAVNPALRIYNVSSFINSD